MAYHNYIGQHAKGWDVAGSSTYHGENSFNERVVAFNRRQAGALKRSIFPDNKASRAAAVPSEHFRFTSEYGADPDKLSKALKRLSSFGATCAQITVTGEPDAILAGQVRGMNPGTGWDGTQSTRIWEGSGLR